MAVSETLKQAWTAVEDADLPEKLHEVAFREAVRLLTPALALAVPSVPPAPPPARPARSGPGGDTSGSGGSGGGSPNGTAGGVSESEDVIFERVEAQTGVSRAKLAELVHLDDDHLKVSIPGIKLGKNNAEKTRAIAQILTIVRGFGLNEAETSVEHVRAEAQRLKCYDQANFSSQLGKLNGFVVTGSASNRRIRSKAAGIESFANLVEKLLGPE